MRRLIIALSFGIVAGSAWGQTEVVKLPLSLSLTNPYVWTNAVWWTNATPPTNLLTWQAWWAMNENLGRLTNAIAQIPAQASGYSMPTNAAPPEAAAVGGGAWLWNSNSVVYLLTSSPGLTNWSATNKLGP